MDEAPHGDEPVYPPATGAAQGAQRRPLLIGLGVLLALAGALIAVTITNDDGGGDDDTAIRDIGRAEDADGADPSSTIESVEPAVNDTVVLVPDDVVLDEWTITDIDDGPLSEEVGEALVVDPSGSDGELEAAVLIEVLPFDSIGDDRPVTVGALTGWYEARDEDGLAQLNVGDGERSLALRSAAGTPLETLTGLASEISFDTPIDEIDPGPKWEVLVTSAVLNEGHGYYVDLVLEDGAIEVQIGAWSGVPDSAMALFDLPFLAEPIDVRQTRGLSMSVWDDRLSLAWLHGPGLTMWLSAVDESESGADLEGILLELADHLVGVDAARWDTFVEEHPVEWTPSYTTTTVDPATRGPIVGELADGREFTVVDGEQGMVCVFSSNLELGCDVWAHGDDLMRPSVADLDEQEVVVFGPLAEGVEEVVVLWNDGLADSALLGRGFWAAAVPVDREPVVVRYWTDVGTSAPEQIGRAMRDGDSWMVTSDTR